MPRVIVPVLALFCLTLLSSCNRTERKPEVVLYFSVDEPYVTPLLKRFEQQTGTHVRAVTDTEATKSAALVERLEAEKAHPQADVYWGNEIFHTINLSERGLFTPYAPPPAADIPTRWRDKANLYTPIGLRARMICFSTRPEHRSLVANLHNLDDLANAALKGKLGICHPGFGTASGHVAALYTLWGEDRFSNYMRALRANEIKLLGGNSAVADQVAAGTLAAGLTDNDDVQNAKADGQALDGRLPDQGDGGEGTLLIPSTIALLRNAPHAENARKLIDFLCDPAIEKELTAGRYFTSPVRDTAKLKPMDIDYTQAAHNMRKAVEISLTILQGR